MAKRRFQLPGIQDLSKEQEDVRALPLEGQHLIIGGPGTGKSVMALLRARALTSAHKNYLFLVFNHLLKQFNQQLYRAKLNSLQWQSWFLSVYCAQFKAAVPRVVAEAGELKQLDWQTIVAECSESAPGDSADLPCLIIDEGQDMPPDFYHSLTHLGYENFFVVADQNQQIVDGKNSSRRDIENALGINSDKVTVLKTNYRNNFPVARLAFEFCTFDPASPPAELPPVLENAVKKPLLFTYRSDQFAKIIRRMLIMADVNPAKLIGVLCPNNAIREKYYQALADANPRLDNGRPLVTTYKYRDQHTMLFDQGGIMVINAQACKGLEFDIVFIADIDQFYFEREDRDRMKRLFYVMVARATEHVIMLRASGELKPIDEIMPTDPDILEIK